MPIYEYQGQRYETAETDPYKALEKIKNRLGVQAPEQPPEATWEEALEPEGIKRNIKAGFASLPAAIHRTTGEILGDEEMVANADAAMREIKDDMQEPPGMSLAQRGVRGAFTSLPQSAALAATTAAVAATAPVSIPVAITAGLAALGTSEGLKAFAEQRHEGEELVPSLAYGTAYGALEAFPEKWAMAPAVDAIKTLGAPGIKTFLRSLGRDVFGEQGTAFGQYLTDVVFNKREMSLKELADELIVTGIASTIASPIQAGAMTAVSSVLPKSPKTPEEFVEGMQEDTRLTGQLMDDKSPEELPEEIPLTPERQALVDNDVILPEAFEEELRKNVERRAEESKAAVAPGLAQDGTTALGINEEVKQSGQIGNTKKVQRNAANYEPNPNDDVPRDQRIISRGPEGSIGHTLATVKTQPGTYLIGQESTDRQQDVLDAHYELYEELRQRYAPNSTLILANESLPGRSAIGGMRRLESGEYLIVPAFARKFSGEKTEGMTSANFQRHTAAKIFYNVFHEFGHVAKKEALFEGILPEVQQRFDAEDRAGQISEETISMLPPMQQAVVREYQQMRAEASQQNARWFQENWLSPALAAQEGLITREAGSRPEFKASDFVRGFVENMDPELKRLGDQIALALNPEERAQLKEVYAQKRKVAENEILSFDEWFAEQMARYAHAKELGKTSKMATDPYFRSGLEYVWQKLRDMFITLKKGITTERGTVFQLAAGVKFTEFMDSLGTMGATFTQPKIETVVKQVRIVEQNKSGQFKLPEFAPVEQARNLRWQVTFGSFTPQQKNELYRLLRRGDYEIVEEKMLKILDSKIVRKQTDIPWQGNGYEQLQAVKELLEQSIASYEAMLEINSKPPFVFDPANKEALPQIRFAIAAYKQELADVTKELARMQKPADVFRLQRDFIAVSDVAVALSERQALNPKMREIAAKEWKTKGTMSRFFRGWFGDWQVGEGSKVVTSNGAPLEVFHSTRNSVVGLGKHSTQAFTTFERGDVGVHFGSLTAAHERIMSVHPFGSNNEQEIDLLLERQLAKDVAEVQDTKQIPKGKDEWYIIGAYLNIRNPLKIGLEKTEMWKTPEDFITWLPESLITVQERIDLAAAIGRARQDITLRAEQDLSAGIAMEMSGYDFEPIRQWLESKGFDGIQYENTVEGGTSWVALRPEQIKSSFGNVTFSDSQKYHLQRDLDLTQPDALEFDNFDKTLKRYKQSLNIRTAAKHFTRLQWYTMQLQQLAHIHPEFEWLNFANETKMNYFASKSRLQAEGDAIIKKWMWLGKEADAKLNRLLEDEVKNETHKTKLERLPDGSWTHTATEETLAWMESFGVKVDSIAGKRVLELLLATKNAQLQQLQEAQRVFSNRLARMVADEDELVLRLNDVRKTFDQLRKTPWLPRGDYGSYGFTLRNDKGEIIGRYMFETEKAMVEGRQKVEKNLAPGQWVKSIPRVSQDHIPMIALPLEFVEMAPDVLGLTQDQVDAFRELLNPIKTDKILRVYDQQTQKLLGGSSDRMRNFANYIWHNSTMLAKVENRAKFTAAKRMASAYRKRVDAAEIDPWVKQTLLRDVDASVQYLNKTIDYMMAPPNELYTLRSFVSLQYLWGNVKTAALNLMGLMTTSAKFLSQYGPVEGSKLMLAANAQMTQRWMGKPLDPLVEKLYDRAIQEGILDQSYATHLAGASTNGNLFRLFNRQRFGSASYYGGTAFYWLANAGMLPFKLAEQYNRRLTFLSALNGMLDKAKKSGRPVEGELENIYKEAVRDTDLLQNSYTLGDRPAFMRGDSMLGPVLPLATIFLSFMQHMAFHTYGGYQLGMSRQAIYNAKGMTGLQKTYTLQLLGAIFVLAGIEGLPGAENVIDMLDVLFHKMFGRSLRQEMRNAVKQLEKAPEALSFLNNPQWWMHGFGHNAAGFDISRSIGIGRIVPGTDNLLLVKDPEDFTGTMLLDSLGVFGGDVRWALQLMMDAGQGKSLGRSLERMPGIGGNIVSAVHWANVGVRGKKGELIYDPSQLEVAGKALGFQPSNLSEQRQMLYEQAREAAYWTQYRTNLLQQYAHARDMDDREAIADTTKAMEDYSDIVPDSRLRILPKDWVSYYRDHLREQRRLEAGFAKERRFQGLNDQIEESFEVPPEGDELGDSLLLEQ